MRSLVRWTAGLLSIAALAKLLGRRRRATSVQQVEPEAEIGPDPAEELRRKLDEVRATAPEASVPEAATDAPAAEEPPVVADESPADAEPPPSPTIEERRAAIHARAQEAIEAMKESDG